MGSGVLITGAGGFIGARLAGRLAADGERVLGCSRRFGDDITEADGLARFENEAIELVFHLAGLTFVPASWEDPGAFYRVNTGGTANVLEFARRKGAGVVYCSAYVYGAPSYLPIDESHPVQPSTPYAHSKWLSEELCRFYASRLDTPTVICRPFNVFGPGQDERFVIPKIIAGWRRHGVVEVQTLAPRRDFLHVDDMVEALLALARGQLDGSTYNAGSGSSCTIGHLVEVLGEITGAEIPVRETGTARRDDIPDVVADCRLVTEGRWVPRMTLRDGLATMVATATRTSSP